MQSALKGANNSNDNNGGGASPSATEEKQSKGNGRRKTARMVTSKGGRTINSSATLAVAESGSSSRSSGGNGKGGKQSARKKQKRRTKKSSAAVAVSAGISSAVIATSVSVGESSATDPTTTIDTNAPNNNNTNEEPSNTPPQFKLNPSRLASGATYQRQEMMMHTLLTKEEELSLGSQVVAARELRESVEQLLEERRWEKELAEIEAENHGWIEEQLKQQHPHVDMEFLSYELEYLSLYGFQPPPVGENGMKDYDLDDELLIDHAQHKSLHLSQLRNHFDVEGGVEPITTASSSATSAATTTSPIKNASNNVGKDQRKKRGYRNSSSSSSASSNSYTPLLHIPIHQLSEQDIISILNIPGGKQQAIQILLDGAYARETLMRKNVKLVMSIAKGWMKNSFTTENANLGGVDGAGGGSGSRNSGNKTSKKFLSQMYEGSWDRPSLDEAVQEGMLGLARAVDKYDPERGLRFSTYATHWITSYVRVCFQRAVTGCLRVPSQLHDIKAAYKKIIKDHLQLGTTPPEQKSIAKELGISEQRLTTAIRATGSLVSVDAPVISPGSGSYKGSAAGGDGSNSQELLILDTLRCAEPKPEDQVEISFLRQCLENAMATELTPYERDVLRLRLGLDSGEGKTVREVVEICGGSVTMSDVRSAERRAFKKLRSPTSVHTHNLLEYLDLAGADKGTLFRR